MKNLINRAVCVMSLLACGISAAASPTTAPTTRESCLGTLVQLTSGFDRAGEAYFSPDMRWIVFQAASGGAKVYQMYVARLIWEDGKLVGAGKPTQISPEPSRNTCGYFSPDGKSLIFASTFGKEKGDEPAGGYQRDAKSYRWDFPTGMEIFRCDDWQKQVAANEGGKVNLASKALTNNNVYDAECAFSPDGQWICYTSGAGADMDIWVMKSDGTGNVRITNAPGYDGGPFFSPDGRRLVYRSDRKGNSLLQIFTCELKFDADGKTIVGGVNERQLTDDGNVNWGPSWHPDGKHIIYSTSAHGHTNYELYLMRDDGSHKTRITYCEGPDILPVFSPDGKYLMWTSRRSAGHTTQIFAAPFRMADGGN